MENDIPTVDGRNPAPPPMHVNNGINYQPQLVDAGFLPLTVLCCHPLAGADFVEGSLGSWHLAYIPQQVHGGKTNGGMCIWPNYKNNHQPRVP